MSEVNPRWTARRRRGLRRPGKSDVLGALAFAASSIGYLAQTQSLATVEADPHRRYGYHVHPVADGVLRRQWFRLPVWDQQESRRLSASPDAFGITLNMAKLSYACVVTRNIERLAVFYREVLHAQPEWTGPYAEFPTGAAIFSLWSMDAYAEIADPEAMPKAGGGPIMLEFEINDVDAEYERLQQLAELKIEFIIPPTAMAWGNRSIYFHDPDDDLLNLFSHVWIDRSSAVSTRSINRSDIYSYAWRT